MFARPTKGAALPFLGTFPLAPVLPSRLSETRITVPSPPPRLPGVPAGRKPAQLQDRSIESLEYKELREASVEYKAAGAGPALQLEQAPGRKPGENARLGVGGGWKVRLRREKSALWGNFHPAHKGRQVSGENSPPSAGQGHLFARKRLDPTGPRRALAGAGVLRTISAIHAEFQSKLSPHQTAYMSVTKPRIKYSAQLWSSIALASCPDPSPGTHGPDKGKRGTEGPDTRGTDPRLGSGAEGAASYQEMQLPLLR